MDWTDFILDFVFLDESIVENVTNSADFQQLATSIYGVVKIN